MIYRFMGRITIMIDYSSWDMIVDGRPTRCPDCWQPGALELDSQWSDMAINSDSDYDLYYCHHCGAWVRFYYLFLDEHLLPNGFYARLPVTRVILDDCHKNDDCP
jgi:hypothetical protein